MRFFGGGELARWRIANIMAKASITGKRGDATHARICSRCDRVRIVFRGLKTVLDRPPMAFDRHQRFDGRYRWTPCGEEGEITIGDTTTDQPTACPKTLICAAKFFDLEIGQFEIAPIMQPQSFGSGPCRQAFPVGRAPRPGDVHGLAGDGSPLAPGMKYMSAADPPAFVAARSCLNNGRIRVLISRSDAAHNATVSSIDAACVHDLRIMVAHGFRNLRKRRL
jgi:hypothetical protein